MATDFAFNFAELDAAEKEMKVTSDKQAFATSTWETQAKPCKHGNLASCSSFIASTAVSKLSG